MPGLDCNQAQRNILRQLRGKDFMDTLQKRRSVGYCLHNTGTTGRLINGAIVGQGTWNKPKIEWKIPATPIQRMENSSPNSIGRQISYIFHTICFKLQAI